jgi:hypothetical protein
VKIDTLERDAVAVARRIEMIVVADQPTDRPAWLPEFRTRYDEFKADGKGKGKGINFPFRPLERMPSTKTALWNWGARLSVWL